RAVRDLLHGCGDHRLPLDAQGRSPTARALRPAPPGARGLPRRVEVLPLHRPRRDRRAGDHPGLRGSDRRPAPLTATLGVTTSGLNFANSEVRLRVGESPPSAERREAALRLTGLWQG